MRYFKETERRRVVWDETEETGRDQTIRALEGSAVRSWEFVLSMRGH
jgi:hypothetical protein